MDLATPDESYREFSILETQRVIDITRSLKKHFPATKRPLIVANIGGFTMDEPLPKASLNDYYERFEHSLSQLDLEGRDLFLRQWLLSHGILEVRDIKIFLFMLMSVFIGARD